MDNVIINEVNNRTLILALDYLYRENMKVYEVETLLPASKSLAHYLEIEILDVPIEGYYNESDELKDYFLTCKSLQLLDEAEKHKVASMEDYALLSHVMSSEIYGSASRSGFFEQRLDPLYFALMDTQPDDWNIETLIKKAHDFSLENDDYSLVGIAAFIKDPVVLTALRESVALYGAVVAGCCLEPSQYKYIWNVDEELELKINKFIRVFNDLSGSSLYKAEASNAEYFYDAFQQNNIIGRCIHIGFDDRKHPIENYHWAIKDSNSDLIVDEFWSTELWTTERYQNEKLYSI